MNAEDYAQNERLIAAIDTSLQTKSVEGGSVRVTLSGGVGQAPSQVCRFCRIQVASGNTEVVRVKINSTCTAENGVELLTYPFLTPYSVDNLNRLYFYSAQANAIVDIEYFS